MFLVSAVNHILAFTVQNNIEAIHAFCLEMAKEDTEHINNMQSSKMNIIQHVA